jgi:hypothetical protein
MATTERTAKALTYTGSGSQAAEIASLRTAISSGNTIFANDLNRIGTLINNMNGHYHTYDDAYQLVTYGNTGDRNNYYEDKNTSVPDQVFAAPTDTAANTTITASRHNELKDSINAVRQHYHEINDRTSI